MDLHKKYIRKRTYFITNQVISSKSLLLLTALLATMNLPPRPVNRLQIGGVFAGELGHDGGHGLVQQRAVTAQAQPSRMD
jgi:hypothetical protein